MNSIDFVNITKPGKEGYYDLLPFTSGTGFSIKRDYPVDLAYKPPLTVSGDPDVVALIHVILGYVTDDDKKRTPLFIHIRSFSKYLENKRDYDFDNKDCPTRISVENSKHTRKPLTLENTTDYYLDGNNTVINKKGDQVRVNDILDTIFNEHCETTHWLKGVKIRAKINMGSRIAKLFYYLEIAIQYLLKTICGRVIEPSRVRIFGKYEKEDMKLLKTEYIEIFGYKASLNVITTFCVIVIFSYILFKYLLKTNLFIDFFSSNVIEITVSILLLSFLQNVLPQILFALMNIMLVQKNKWQFRKYEI